LEAHIPPQLQEREYPSDRKPLKDIVMEGKIVLIFCLFWNSVKRMFENKKSYTRSFIKSKFSMGKSCDNTGVTLV